MKIMKKIPVTIYLRPNGRTKTDTVLIDTEIADYIIAEKIKVGLEAMDETKIIGYFDHGLTDEEGEPIEIIIIEERVDKLFDKAIDAIRKAKKSV